MDNMHHVHHNANLDLIDQTLDNAIVQQRAEEVEAAQLKQINKLIDRKGPAPLAGADTMLSESEIEVAPEKKFKDMRILYNSMHRGAMYNACAWLWCGCLEPKYKITASYAIGEEWHGCCMRVMLIFAYAILAYALFHEKRKPETLYFCVCFR